MRKSTWSIVLIAGIIIVLNLLSNEFFFRLDTTEDKSYTLSKATRSILTNLSEPITLSSYFTGDLPPQYSKNLTDFKDLLKEYNRRSSGMVNFEFIDPNKDPSLEQEAAQNGIQPLLINVREKNEVIQKKAFMGAVLKAGESQEVLPFIQPQGPMEYQLTKAIKKLSNSAKPVIGLISGHGEASTQNLAEVYQELSVLYDIEDVNLNQVSDIPARIKTLLMVNPQDSIPEAHFNILDRYMSQGGNLCLAVNTVAGDFQSVQGSALNTGIPSWLYSKGIGLSESFVLDAQCGSVGVTQKQGFFSFQSQVQFPYFPRVISFPEHPVTKGIEQIIFPFASAITNEGTSTMIPLVFSSDQTATQNPPVYFDIQKQWRESDFPDGQQVLVAAFEDLGVPGKMVIFSDADFAISQGRNSRTNADNFSLLVNSVDWLSDDTGLIDLRTKGVSSRPIEDMEEAKVNMYKWGNFLIPILLVLFVGFYRNQRNRTQRLKRMAADYR